ncbi:Hypp7497 [Branchiostoma lanceolatum]|uniref:Hypp7497 protein n=1 Tax=Branchiostoma lanceolatum TaxID=7740 RepID=A0A8J9Z0W8_BRALA|nr:Hypp7497 [Branchiostoma lanceolatum]
MEVVEGWCPWGQQTMYRVIHRSGENYSSAPPTSRRRRTPHCWPVPPRAGEENGNKRRRETTASKAGRTHQKGRHAELEGTQDDANSSI